MGPKADGTEGREPCAFEDLSEDEQNRVMKDRPVEWLESLAKALALCIRGLGDQFDIVVNNNDVGASYDDTAAVDESEHSK